MRILVDMNLSPKWTGALEDSGIEAVHWSQIGAAKDGDPQIMAYAKEHGYIVLTNDLDFGSILAATRGNAPSVVQLRTDDTRLGTIGAKVIQSLQLAREQLAEGALVTIETNKLRVTSLPIGLAP
jgi:predicted nuclease of predicted toxin-antitoxin system